MGHLSARSKQLCLSRDASCACLHALMMECACLQPMYPGQTHRIRRNLLNFVLAVDLGTPDGLAAAAAAQTLFQQQLPVRWGVLPLNTSLRIGGRMKRGSRLAS